MSKVIKVVVVSFSILGMLSCKRPGKKIERFKDGSIAIIYEYPNRADTMTYTYIENYPNGRIHKKFSVEKNMIVGYPTVYYPSGKIYEIDSLYHSRDVNS